MATATANLPAGASTNGHANNGGLNGTAGPGGGPPAAPPPAGPTADTSEFSPHRWIILAGLMTAAVMEVLDTTIVNVSLPQMAGNLSATATEIAWVSTGYILSNVVVLPITAFLTSVFGRRNYLTASIIIFIIASFMCGTSHTLGELVFWRVMQGAGGAALLSTAQATIRQIFPREQQGLVQAVFIMGIIVAPTLGPTLGGYITENYTWNWCFFINVPIGIVSAILVMTFLHDPPNQVRHTGRVDFLGISLLGLGLASLQYVLEEGRSKDWFESALIVKLALFASACLVAMMFWELSPRNQNPVIDFKVLRNRNLSASILLFISLGFGLYGGTYLFPLFAQQLLGFTPTETGLALMPGGLATAAAALICGRLLGGAKPLIDPRVLIYIGVGIFLVAMWQLGHLTTAAGEPEVRFALLIRGLALGFLFAPINNVAYASIEPHEAQQASGLMNLARQLGGSFGIAILGTYLNNHTQIHRAELVTHINNAGIGYQQFHYGLMQNLAIHGYPALLAQQKAFAIIDFKLQRQASLLGYNDCWMLLVVAFICASPAILLLQKPKPRKAAVALDVH